MLLVALIVVGAALFATGIMVCCQARPLRASERDRPATLEGGGSHLTVRKGK